MVVSSASSLMDRNKLFSVDSIVGSNDQYRPGVLELPQDRCPNLTRGCSSPQCCYSHMSLQHMVPFQYCLTTGLSLSPMMLPHSHSPIHRLATDFPVNFERTPVVPSQFSSDECSNIVPSSLIPTSFIPTRPLTPLCYHTEPHDGNPVYMQRMGKSKRLRTAFTSEQLTHLEQEFEKNPYVIGDERRQLAASLKLSETKVKVWFQNKRTKHKRQKMIDGTIEQSNSAGTHSS